ncbi:MAG: response regulator [Deltaproteobacteria bacterium]|nr:response regulator [Deltaproteobacteria bacterium]
MRVLVVDDCEIMRDVLLRFLHRMEIHPEFAHNGAEAVSAAGVKSFDVILMDLEMPVLDGRKATHFIRQTGASKDARIIAVTASSVDEELVGFDGYLKKLPTFEALAAFVQKTTLLTKKEVS